MRKWFQNLDHNSLGTIAIWLSLIGFGIFVCAQLFLR